MPQGNRINGARPSKVLLIIDERVRQLNGGVEEISKSIPAEIAKCQSRGVQVKYQYTMSGMIKIQLQSQLQISNCMRKLADKYLRHAGYLNPLCSFSFASTPCGDLPINNYLKQNLISNHIYEVKQFQHQVFKESRNGLNCFLNSCTGSGKTLAYLLPILDQLMTTREAKADTRNMQHGAVILTLNKELCLQIYKTIRMLDPLQKLDVKRTGPISHYLPVVNLLSNPPQSQRQADLIDAKINDNLVNNVKWPKTDILISTPQLLYNIMSMSECRSQKDLIYPQFVVVDEADLLLEIDKNLSKFTFQIVDQLNKNMKKLKRNEKNMGDMQYFISSSSFPHKLGKIDYFEGMNKKFGPTKEIKGQSQHQIPSSIELFFIEMQKMPENKLYYVKDILKSRQGQRVIIFCNNKKSVQEVSAAITNDLKIDCDVYHASLDSNQRSRVLHRFEMGTTQILVSSDLGSRGLDFTVPVNLIIEYEMAENVTGFINRVGRTGRNNVRGEVVTLVTPENKELFQHIQELVSRNEKLDEVFSRKRSYSKLYKQKQR